MTIAARWAKAMLPQPLRHMLWRWWGEFRLAPVLFGSCFTGAARRTRPVRLPAQLVVSLTSHRTRFPFLHRTLRSLLAQTVRPDHLILWIADDDRAALPAKVLRLGKRGLTIRTGPDLGPFRKLVLALEAFPDAFIVTADDDLFYPPDWLERLIETHDEAAPSILCHRAHRPTADAEGRTATFSHWARDVQDANARRPCVDLIPTGGAGAFYPPGSLDSQVLDPSLFLTLCPSNDDFWFFWMARRAGSTFRKVGGPFRYRDWPGSQQRTLHSANLAGEYDRQFARLAARYGIPEGLAGHAHPGAKGSLGEDRA